MSTRAPSGSLGTTLRRAIVALGLLAVSYLWIPQFVSLLAPAIPGEWATSILATLTRIPSAQDKLNVERERTAAEQEAFDRFTKRINRLDPVEVNTASNKLPGNVGTSDPLVLQETGGSTNHPNDSIDSVKKAYRETVMAVPHYDEEYAESFEKNLEMEFGPELATMVTSQSELTQPIQRALIVQSEQSRTERANLLRVIDEDEASILDARDALEQIDEDIDRCEETNRQSSVGDVVGIWDRLEPIEERCRAVLVDRQRHLQGQSQGVDQISFQEYLYRDQAWTFPVLGDGLDCYQRIQDVKSKLAKSVQYFS